MELIQPLTADEYRAFAEEENADPRPPSECTADWVWARALDISQSLLGRPAGKWTIRGYAPQIDALWSDVRILTRAGLFATAKAGAMPDQPGVSLLMVYTDADDDRAIGEALATLRRLGIQGARGTLTYKTDEATAAGLSGSDYIARNGAWTFELGSLRAAVPIRTQTGRKTARWKRALAG